MAIAEKHLREGEVFLAVGIALPGMN